MTASVAAAPLPETAPVLGIDTALGVCAVALLIGDRVAARRAVRSERGHAERLVPMIGDVLAAAALRADALAAIAVNLGPGTFTGIRIGLAGAIGLRIASGVPLIGIAGFDAVAADCRASGLWQPATAPLAICFDSRRGNLFVQILRPDGAGPAQDLTLAEAVHAVGAETLLAGDGAAKLASARGAGPAPLAVAGEPDPATLARLARDVVACRILPARPLYLRPPDARLPQS